MKAILFLEAFPSCGLLLVVLQFIGHATQPAQRASGGPHSLSINRIVRLDMGCCLQAAALRGRVQEVITAGLGAKCR